MSPRLTAALLLLALPTAAPAGVRIVRVWPEHRDAGTFTRLVEYFGGQEYHFGQTVLRSRENERAGYYFLVRTRADAPVAGATFLVEAVLPGDPEVKAYPFHADLPAGQRVFQLGLTGADWPGAKVRPAAWRVTVRAPDGTLLTERQSFLWAGPPAK